MIKLTLAARSNLRNALLCSLLTLGLAACGAEGGAGGEEASASTVSDSTSAAQPLTGLVSPNVGLIDRSQQSDTAVVAGSNTGSNSGSGSGSSNSGSNAPVSGTVAVNHPSPPPANSSGNATLDWMPPTENSDGSVLTNLAGYTVYYGNSPDHLTQSIKVANPGLTAYTIADLGSGTWYFAVTSYSASGVESTRSGTVSTTI